MAYDEISFDDETVGGARLEKYKIRKDVVDRVGVPFPTRLKRAKVHYHADKGYFECLKGLCCEKLGPPKDRLGTVVVQYRTDARGRIQKPFGYTIKSWVFSGRKFEDLREINSEHPLAKHDVKIKGGEEKYQQMTFFNCAESLWQKNPQMKEQIAREAEAAMNNIYLASKIDTDQLRDLLGIENALDAGLDTTSDQDFDDLLDGDLGLDLD
tara:strand:+ start:1978 stop:2610 length:633 start_codon:yes stop_codon:yes gene_type:complete